ncbi:MULTISPECIES: hypothetical protein [Rhizobium]|uniref:Lipoprotein n=1 Tax=Rhizobium tropici TaxID=398 RepID=A0A6P1CEX9_RHITR|nr:MULTISPECIES: hypothetical protein [Rhizobium]AGB71012.1 hypothetical protein RTCIAT899_CH08100 [Rhizobium tropici CIAT 899]MBB4242397.1 hypothetical protein [Rhizobium tropici]MBB5594040.1 hypothetical protein [Rhizobium tropici]MBB6492839.1 hypothetical protein [Rhizobium tropici]NEV13374.1 hypothetical protein [Rhizobium tropici]
MCDQQILYGRKKLASTIAVLASFVMIASCATTAKKPTETSDIAPAAQPTAAEQLATDMNNRADARRRNADLAYRDPLVHSVNGTRQQIVAQQNQALYPAPVETPPEGQTGIAGLVTQPTGVNASRSSIFSAPPPIAVNPDGTLAKAGADGAQPITPMMRSVYSTPPSAMPTTAPPAMDAAAPNGRTSADMLPPPVIRNATSPAAGSPQPIAQVTASGAAAMPTPNVHELNGRQAAALAQFIASKNQPQNGKLLVQPVQGATGQ